MHQQYLSYFLYRYIFPRKIIYSLKKNPNKKSAEKKWRNFDFISIVKLQNLTYRISVPPIQKQPFANVLQSSCF